MAIADKQATYEAPGRLGSLCRSPSVGVVRGSSDVADGPAESLSLEGLEGVHFVARDRACEISHRAG